MIALFAEAPALPLHTAGKYVAAAYIVFVLVLLVYVSIMATRLTRSQRELLELRRQFDARESLEAEPIGDPVFPPNDNESHSHLGAEQESSVDPAELP